MIFKIHPKPLIHKEFFMDAPLKALNTEKAKALQAALAQIEKQFGKGTIMSLGAGETAEGAGASGLLSWIGPGIATPDGGSTAGSSTGGVPSRLYGAVTGWEAGMPPMCTDGGSCGCGGGCCGGGGDGDGSFS